jgi:hypothetical protein
LIFDWFIVHFMAAKIGGIIAKKVENLAEWVENSRKQG